MSVLYTAKYLRCDLEENRIREGEKGKERIIHILCINVLFEVIFPDRVILIRTNLYVLINETDLVFFFFF